MDCAISLEGLDGNGTTAMNNPHDMKQGSSVLRAVERSLQWLTFALCLGFLVLASIYLVTTPDDWTFFDMGVSCFFLGGMMYAGSAILRDKLEAKGYSTKVAKVLWVLSVIFVLVLPILLFVVSVFLSLWGKRLVNRIW